MRNHQKQRPSQSRRNFVKGLASGYLVINAQPSLAFRSDSKNTLPSSHTKKLVWVFLRGALDSLHTVVPTGDSNLYAHRASLLAPIKDGLLPLENGYALHPQLPFLHSLYKKKQMSAVVAVASGYRERSHFDAQDEMESGLDTTNHDDGWLARVSDQIQGNSVAISRSVPIALRSSQRRAETWYPSSFPEANEDTLSRLSQMYADDASLQANLDALMVQKNNPNMQMQEQRRANFPYLAKRCGELLSNNDNTQCAMLELGGWDTHNNQVGRLARLFTHLETGLQNMQQSLGDAWDDTLVVVSTEFGRTVSVNGTFGTDHGTGANMFVLGGALARFSANNNNMTGGKVLGNWPGLHPEALFESRDLMPTSDVRHWIAKALAQHWQLSNKQLSAIFPDIKALV